MDQGFGLHGCDPLRAGCKEVSQRVPFFAAPEVEVELEDEWQGILRPALDTYEASYTQALVQLARAQQVAFYSEHNMLFLQSTGTKNDHNNNMHNGKKLFHQMISKHLERLAPMFEHNIWVMRSILLRPFVFCQAIAEPPPFINNSDLSSHAEDPIDVNTESNDNCDDTDTACGKEDNVKWPAAKNSIHHDDNSGADGRSETDHGTIKEDPHAFRQAFQWMPKGRQKVSEGNEYYDSVEQVMAHLVRDWTEQGRQSRRLTLDWCCQQLVLQSNQKQFWGTNTNKHATHHQRVLVPGAGMGRLAYDIASLTSSSRHNGVSYSVEANEVSLVMAAGAHSILNHVLSDDEKTHHGKGSSSPERVVYPFAADRWMNEVDASQQRFQAVTFPDKPVDQSIRGSLSYTVGDFVDVYANRTPNEFDAIVTCFFLDTATNLFEYLSVIMSLLKDTGGVWINVGPVQWHGNALVQPSVVELKAILETMGFSIQHWSLDTQPVPYRNDITPLRSTKIDAYLPLRFVAVWNRPAQGASSCDQQQHDTTTNNNSLEQIQQIRNAVYGDTATTTTSSKSPMSGPDNKWPRLDPTLESHLVIEEIDG
eukprot:scaffold36048_cov49-Attheya_sp.AAC.1